MQANLKKNGVCGTFKAVTLMLLSFKGFL